MKATTFERYGDESVLQVRDIFVPVAGPGEVLVRVTVASLNPVDFKLRSGMLKLLRLPRLPAVTGKDFAGVIAAVGAGVQGYAPGQRVFGSVDPMKGKGSCAEMLAIPTSLICATPDALSDEQAACLPVASGTALQALRDIAQLKAGQHVLITGASGAVGSSAVAIAKHLGARVTGVAGSVNLDYVRSLGADDVVDYRQKDWRSLGGRYQVIFDAAASASFGSARPLLEADGVYINTMPRPDMVLSALFARLSSRQRLVPFLLKTDHALLADLAELASQGVIVQRVAQRIGLAEVASAQAAMQSGALHGKVCVLP